MAHINSAQEQERQWVRAAQNGDQEAFSALVLRHRHSALLFATGILGDAFTAEDIVQESFAKAWFRLAAYRPVASFKSWLYAIIRNGCIDYLRGHKAALPLEQAANLPSGPGPQELLAQKEEWRQFRQCWGSLGENARCALYLFAVRGMGYAQIAQAMNKNTGQVKMTIYRARKKLAHMRGKGENEP